MKACFNKSLPILGLSIQSPNPSLISPAPPQRSVVGLKISNPLIRDLVLVISSNLHQHKYRCSWKRLMKNKRSSSHPYHSWNSYGFRNSVSGTRYEDQIYYFLLYPHITAILLICLIQNIQKWKYLLTLLLSPVIFPYFRYSGLIIWELPPSHFVYYPLLPLPSNIALKIHAWTSELCLFFSFSALLQSAWFNSLNTSLVKILSLALVVSYCQWDSPLNHRIQSSLKLDSISSI